MTSLPNSPKNGKSPTKNTRNTRHDTQQGFRPRHDQLSPSEIAQRVSWTAILSYCGAEVGRFNRTRCLVHQGDSLTSFAFDEEKGVAHCHACQWGGDKISFIKAVHGLDFRGALQTLARLAGVPLQRRRGPPRPPDPELTRRQRYQSWQQQRLNELLEEKRAAELEREIISTAWGAIHRAPHLYSDNEFNYWRDRAAAFHNRAAEREYQIDLLKSAEKETQR
jgi:hypothetical protein